MPQVVARLTNLKRLKLTPTDLVQRVGSRSSFWSDLLAGRKSFGEKLARKIEDKLELPPGWLDEPRGTDEPTPGREDMMVLPLREGEADLLTAYRLLRGEHRSEILERIFELVRAEHDLTSRTMERLRVATRAPDARVHEVLGGIPKVDPGRRKADVPVDVDRRKK